MKILIKESKIIAVSENISFGRYDEDCEKWRIADADDNVMYYILDDGYALINDVLIPEDYQDGKYFYENNIFVLNREWKPYVSPEERLAQLAEQLSIAEENDAELLYQVCLLQLGICEEDLL